MMAEKLMEHSDMTAVLDNAFTYLLDMMSVVVN